MTWQKVMSYRSEETIEEKISIAGSYYLRWGDELKMDPEISARIEELSARIKASSELSVRSGVSGACQICEEEEGGSCCGAGIENRYSPELLLINLLLGATLPFEKEREAGSGEREVSRPESFHGFRVSRRDMKSCYFLGESGCILAAREILCINYLCSKLQKTISQEMLLDLQEANGSEMDLIFLLHDRIRGFIRQKGK